MTIHNLVTLTDSSAESNFDTIHGAVDAVDGVRAILGAWGDRCPVGSEPPNSSSTKKFGALTMA